MIGAEYLRFLQTLTGGSASADGRKLANLVLNHLDELIPLSTAQGQRIKKVVKLAQENWNTISDDIQPTPQQTTNQTVPFAQIKSLSVGPFRGFAKQENFDLASPLVLIYGPNGTGKSSFCEALEFGLLGSVAEAESKRFRNQQEYLKNAHTKSFTPPALVGLDSQGSDILISANEALYRFCFVEKNRIDNFSRIAAQAPAKQTELISTLFGLDAFTDFVRNFTDTIDGKYIENDISELETKQDELSKSSQQVSFKQLYEAITKVQESSPKQCPACQTPIAQVKVNPFDHADTELKKLKYLGRLQEEIKTIRSGVDTSLQRKKPSCAMPSGRTMRTTFNSAKSK
jgi:DNA repair exonuclease SbcCD ATPase subunit